MEKVNDEMLRKIVGGEGGSPFAEVVWQGRRYRRVLYHGGDPALI